MNDPKPQNDPLEDFEEKRDALIAAIRKAAIYDACYALDWIARKCDTLRFRLKANRLY